MAHTDGFEYEAERATARHFNHTVEYSDDWQLKTHKVWAKQFTEDRADEVARWCGGQVNRKEKASDPTDISVQLVVPNVGGFHYAKFGDYVVRGEDGRFTVETQEDFEEKYERIPQTKIISGVVCR